MTPERDLPEHGIAWDTSTTIMTPHGESEQLLGIRRSDWNRLKKRLRHVKPSKLAWVTDAGWAVLGIGVSSLLGLLVWNPAYDSLPPSAQDKYNWVGPLLGLAGGLLVLAAVGCFIVGKQSRLTLHEEIDAVADDMDDVEAACVLVSEGN